MTRRGCVPALLLLAMLIPGAPRALGGDDGSYVLLQAGGPESLQRKLRGPAADGYRILGACHGLDLQGNDRVVALLEKSAAAAAPYEYVALGVSGDLGREGVLDRVNELGAEGYRLFQRHVFAQPAIDWWLPAEGYDDQMTLILERGPQAAPREYEALAYSTPQAFQQRLDEHVAAGFDVLGLWNTYRRPRLLLERALDDRVPASEAAGDGDYRMLVVSTRHGLKRALERYGLEGYRIYDSADQAVLAPPIVILERSADPTEAMKFKLLKQPFEKIRKDKLEKKLNKRGRRGFRALPRSLTGTLLILQREGKRADAPPLEYRALSSKSAPGIPRGMQELVPRGFRFVAMFHGSDETTVLLAREREGGTTAGTWEAARH
jgi:hypothetical protein